MQCQAPDANVLLLLRRKSDGVVLGTIWGMWSDGELAETFNELNKQAMYVGSHFLHSGSQVNIEVLIVGEVK